MDTIFKYLKQPSTLRGIIGVLGAFGLYLSPDQIEAVIALVLAALGVVEVFRDEDKPIEAKGGTGGQGDKGNGGG